MTNSRKISISIPSEQADWLEEVSRLNSGCGVSKIIQSLISDEMDREEKTSPVEDTTFTPVTGSDD